MNKQNGYWHLIIAVLIAVTFYLVPVPLVPFAVKAGLGLAIAGIYLWIKKPLPLGLSALAVVVAAFALGLINTTSAVGNMLCDAALLLLSSFAISVALRKTSLPVRLLFYVLKFSKGRADRFLLGYFGLCMLFSLVMPNIVCTALFTSFAVSIVLEAGQYRPGHSNFGKCLMIGIPLAVQFGGLLLPVGNTAGILVWSAYNNLTNASLLMTDWLLLTAPFALSGVVLVWFLLKKIYKPEALNRVTRNAISEAALSAGPLTKKEKAIIGFLILIVALWCSSFWTGLPEAMTAAICLIIYLLPGIGPVRWQEFKEEFSLDITICVESIRIFSSGIAAKCSIWLSDLLSGQVFLTAAPPAVLIASLLPIVRIFIPSSTALTAVLAVSLMEKASSLVVSPLFIAMTLICAGTPLLNTFDIENIPAYHTGHYKAREFLLIGLIPMILFVLLSLTWFPFVIQFKGF